jgi:hypothetical protein
MKDSSLCGNCSNAGLTQHPVTTALWTVVSRCYFVASCSCRGRERSPRQYRQEKAHTNSPETIDQKGAHKRHSQPAPATGKPLMSGDPWCARQSGDDRRQRAGRPTRLSDWLHDRRQCVPGHKRHRVQRRVHRCPGEGTHKRRCASEDGPAGGCSGAVELDRGRRTQPGFSSPISMMRSGRFRKRLTFPVCLRCRSAAAR